MTKYSVTSVPHIYKECDKVIIRLYTCTAVLLLYKQWRTATATGRPKTSPVWDYFCYNEDEDDSSCQIVMSNRGMCGAK